MTRRKSLAILALALATGLAPVAGAADSWKKKNNHGYDDRRDTHRYVEDYRGCPPGLAKKNNGCRPPGQAKKEQHVWRNGDRITRDYIVIRDPRRYNLDPRYTYWQSGDYVYRVDRDTGKVMALIGALSNLLR